MKNGNKMRGRGVQFGLKRENQSNPKSKNQKKMTLRRRGIEVKKLNREGKKKEGRGRGKRGRGKKKEKREGRKRGERENFPLDHQRRNPTSLPPSIPWLRLII